MQGVSLTFVAQISESRSCVTFSLSLAARPKPSTLLGIASQNSVIRLPVPVPREIEWLVLGYSLKLALDHPWWSKGYVLFRFTSTDLGPLHINKATKLACTPNLLSKGPLRSHLTPDVPSWQRSACCRRSEEFVFSTKQMLDPPISHWSH